MINTLQYYISCFTSMNCNKYRGQVAPHKAMMLIAVMDEIANGHLTNGFVPHNDRMVKAFEFAWQRYVGKSSVFNPVFSTPFFHLSNEPFWKLMKSDCYIERKENLWRILMIREKSQRILERKYLNTYFY